MAEILKEWLTERLQRPIKWEAEEFGDMMKNGYIIASVLLSYHVINDEKHYQIRHSYSREDIKNNWKLLCEWLREIEVNISDADLSNIMEGKGSSLLRLFYQLFLHLDKKDRTDFIKRERKMVSKLVDKIGHRFKVDKVEEEKESFVDDLSRPLLNERVYIEWQQKKTEQVKETFDYIRHKYNKTLSGIHDKNIPKQLKYTKNDYIFNKSKTEMDNFSLKYPCKYENYTYEQLLELDEKAVQRKESILDTDWAKSYMSDLYTRIHKKTDSEEFQTQMRTAISSSLWDLSVAEEETKHDTSLAKKVMKLSQFEKQMCTQIMETKQQARNLTNNRIQGEKEFTEQREQQFNEFLDDIKEQINLEVFEIDFEKHRQNMLHKRLYEEKIKRKRQHYYEICYETMLSLVDYAVKYAQYQKLIGEDEIPDCFIKEWKNLFFKHQAIFDILEPVEDILEEQDMEEQPIPEVEEIIRLELIRQDALNDCEFIEYHNYLYPWTLELLIPNYDSESDDRKFEYLGSRILGHIVYTLLDIKYAYPAPLPAAGLPEFLAKVILRGLPDNSITVPMQILLNQRKIHVVRLENAINFCLRQFKTEMIGCIDIELNFDKLFNAAQEEDQRDLIRLMKAEDDALSKSSNISAILGVLPPNAKQTQTPKTIPEEEMVLSASALLGQYAYEALGAGESLTDHLLAAIIVEYIKDQSGINGFVIINYPNSYREAQILEETFTGRGPPDEEELDDRDDFYLEESIAKHRKTEKDPYKEIRVSKLVNDPHKKRTETPFATYFTSYILLKATDDILQELFIWDLDTENSEFLDRFYAALGINYSMYYEVIDKEFLATICKYIIGDLVMPIKSANELFGESVLSNLDFHMLDDKRRKSKVIKPELSTGKSKQALRRGSKNSKTSVSAESEPIKESITSAIPQLEDMAEEEESQWSMSGEESPILAGEEDWVYGEIPICEVIGVALATCWEEIEKAYIHDMQQLFFAKRLQMNCLCPYTRFIKDKMEQIITLPSEKQDIVSKFQKEYNDFENDWRDVNLSKNEWHCRVKDLQHKLFHICDERKLFATQKRQELICENWAFEELTSMANTYISCMQAELNRSILTFQTLHDFYFTMIKGIPSKERLASKDLTKIFRETLQETPGSKPKEEKDKLFKELKMAYQELQHQNISIDFSNNPFNMIIEDNVKLALKFIKDTNDSYRSLISKEYVEVMKLAPPVTKKDVPDNDETVDPEEILKQNLLKCIDEWTMGVNGEMFRASLRIEVLQYKCHHDMKLFNDFIYKAFIMIENDINSYYLNEITSVNRLCKYLQMAVEDGRRIPETLILEHDTFTIDPNLLQFAPSESSSITGELSELDHKFEFKIGQLSKLRSKLKIIAPTGIALQQAFIYILQDFYFFGKESCDGRLFPEMWMRIDPNQMAKLTYLLFGETTYVDWRDFLIYGLNIRFPTVYELLELRQRFRCTDYNSTELISRDDFIKLELWFEPYFHLEDKYAQLRKVLMKHFLFELFEVQCNYMNYSAFLLAFCKSKDPIEGFASALSMAVGKKVCYIFEECEEIVCKLIEDKKYRDSCKACAKSCANMFLDNLLENVVNICEATTIEELPYEPEPVEENIKSKQGKGDSPKAKGPKAHDSNKLKSTPSLVKTTFICRPCEEVVKEEEKEIVEEEHIPEVHPDPDIVYTVKQEVIWNVLKICLPWHFVLVPSERKTPYIEQVEEAMKSLEDDADDGDIYICKFVKNTNVCKILHNVRRFEAIKIVEEELELKAPLYLPPPAVK